MEEYIVPDLAEGTNFEFRICATNDVGQSGWTESEPIAAVCMFSESFPFVKRFICARNTTVHHLQKFLINLALLEPLKYLKTMCHCHGVNQFLMEAHLLRIILSKCWSYLEETGSKLVTLALRIVL